MPRRNAKRTLVAALPFIPGRYRGGPGRAAWTHSSPACLRVQASCLRHDQHQDLLRRRVTSGTSLDVDVEWSRASNAGPVVVDEFARTRGIQRAQRSCRRCPCGRPTTRFKVGRRWNLSANPIFRVKRGRLTTECSIWRCLMNDVAISTEGVPIMKCMAMECQL